jgi:hypothetical protein
MDFETYLISKKIDSLAFKKAEPEVWRVWMHECAQMHPDSFTMQKLNLINPIRRKYSLKTVTPKAEELSSSASSLPAVPMSSNDLKPADPPAVKPKPVFKPKPKMS